MKITEDREKLKTKIAKEKEKRKTQEKKLRQLAASGDADIVIDGKPAGDNFDLDGIRLKDYEIKFKNGKVYLISYWFLESICMRKDFTVKQFNEKIYFFGFYAIRSFFAVLGISAILVAFLYNIPLCAPFGFSFLLFVDLSGIHYNRFFRKRFPAYFRARSMQEIEAFGDQIKSEFFVYVVCVSIVGPYIAIVQKETTLIFPLIILTAIYSYVVWKLPHIEAFEIKR